MRPVSWGLVVGTTALVVVASAHADSTSHLVVDQIELEPASVTGQLLRIYVSSQSREGQHVDLEPRSIKLMFGTSELKAPLLVSSYGPTNDTAIVVVVQASASFAEVLPVITDALDQNVLASASERTQVAVLTYSDAIGADRLASVKTARAKLPGLSAQPAAVGEPVLLDALERALVLLKKAKTTPEGRPLRKMILAIGDGRDLSGDRDRVIRIGKRAAKESVRIHSFAYSPKDLRRPLLLLGELSKQSHGTFRWVRGAQAQSWTPAFQQLHDEIDKQSVLLYFVPGDEDLAEKKLRIVSTGRLDATSNELKVPPLGCQGQPCELGGYCVGDRCMVPKPQQRRGVLGWILIIGGIALGAITVLGFVGFLMSKRQQVAAPALPPGVQPGMPLPGSVAPAAPAKKSKPPKTKTSKPPKSVPPEVAQAAPAVITGPRFLILAGPRTDQVLALRHGFTIGKAPTCDLVIDDGYTSSQHAQIGMDHFGNCRVYDQGSTNGTFVNGVRITESIIEHGNTVRIGSTELRFLAQ